MDMRSSQGGVESRDNGFLVGLFYRARVPAVHRDM